MALAAITVVLGALLRARRLPRRRRATIRLMSPINGDAITLSVRFRRSTGVSGLVLDGPRRLAVDIAGTDVRQRHRLRAAR